MIANMINKNNNIDVPTRRASDNALSICLFYFKWKEGVEPNPCRYLLHENPMLKF